MVMHWNKLQPLAFLQQVYEISQSPTAIYYYHYTYICCFTLFIRTRRHACADSGWGRVILFYSSAFVTVKLTFAWSILKSLSLFCFGVTANLVMVLVIWASRPAWLTLILCKGRWRRDRPPDPRPSSAKNCLSLLYALGFSFGVLWSWGSAGTHAMVSGKSIHFVRQVDKAPKVFCVFLCMMWLIALYSTLSNKWSHSSKLLMYV